ncbi:hypothetical protein LTS18_003048, partial [Coniosporium uncinatum]
AIGIHPKYLFATLDKATYDSYRTRVEARQKKAYRYFHDGLINNTMFRAKDKSPYEDAQMNEVFLNPDARVSANKKTKAFNYPANLVSPPKNDKNSEETRQMVESLAKATATENTKVGVDVESVEAVNIQNETFVERNFTDKEQEYCRKAPSPQASFAGRWSAKEAVFKALGVESKGAGAALKEIEVTNDENGAPVVTLHGDAQAAAKKAGVKAINVSISHSDSQAIAIAMASF